MPFADTPSPARAEHWVAHPQGRLFARSWTPARAPASRAPVVLLHDSLGCVDLWRDFPAALAAAAGRRVIAYDRLGFGQSDARHGRPELDFIADEARTYFPFVRAHFDLSRFVVLGHSVGGSMAIHCAVEAGDGCEALITESAQVFVEDRTISGIREAQALFRDPVQRKRLSRYHGGKAAWVLDAWTGCWLDPAFAGWTLDAVLPDLRCPVLALHGIDDEYGSARHPAMIGERAGGPSQVDVLPGTRHVPHRERAPEVLDRITAFLEQTSARTSG